ncbi:MAG: hypothetical protein Q9207_004746 [Kuettlingeria erythrocarpa]
MSTAHVIKPSRSIFNRQRVPLNISQVDADTVSYNGWMISGCGGGAQGMTPELSDILLFLFDMKPNLEAVIADARLGTRSPHGFTAFFKTSTNIRTVVNRYRQVLEVGPVIVSAERAKVIGTRTPQPTFQCIKENDPETADMTEGCNRIPFHYPVIFIPRTERLWLCPRFFTTVNYPSPKQYCPAVGADGKFKPGDGRLMGSNFAYLVQSLVFMYGRDLYTPHINFNRRADMQYAVELNARQSVLSVSNYGFYAGGKLERDDDFEGDVTANVIYSGPDAVHELPENERTT